MSLTKRCFAELLGTAWLVLGGCGTAILAGRFAGIVGVALAFGLTVMTAAYALGPISGAHLNPAVSVGLAVGKRFAWRDVGPYAVAQVLGAALGAAVIWAIVYQQPGFDAIASGFSSNGFGDHSPGHFPLQAAAIVEVVLTFFFVLVILGVTEHQPASAPVAIGLCLTLIHLISIPITNTSVNPARSTGPALFAGPAALSQLGLFWAAPIVGAIIAGLIYPRIGKRDTSVETA